MSVPSGNLTYGKIAQLAWWSCQKNSSTPRGSPNARTAWTYSNYPHVITLPLMSHSIPIKKTTIFVAWFHHAPLFSVKSPYLHHAYHIQCWTQTRWCRCPPVQPRPRNTSNQLAHDLQNREWKLSKSPSLPRLSECVWFFNDNISAAPKIVFCWV